MVYPVTNRIEVGLHGRVGMLAHRLVAGVLVRHNEPPDIPSSAELLNWSELGTPARQQALAKILREYLASRQCPTQSVELVALENDIQGRPVRAVCSFMPGCVPSDDSLPRFIRGLERHVRTVLKVPVELLADEEKDRNKLRQLIVVAKSGEGRG